jgi:hypothetical protein
MNMRNSRAQHGICRGLLVAAATAWFVAQFMADAAEHPEHPTANTTAAAEDRAESAGLLDGKVFEGEMGKTGDQTGDKDEFVFQHGKFASTACVQYGFDEAPYVATEQDGVVSFTCEVKNARGETMSWKGVLNAGGIEGTALYQTAKDQTEYWFKGSLKAAEAKSKPEHPEHPK